jgi:hypothetical protein
MLVLYENGKALFESKVTSDPGALAPVIRTGTVRQVDRL